MNGILISINRGDKMLDITLIALVGIISMSIIVPVSTIAMLKVVPRNGDTT